MEVPVVYEGKERALGVKRGGYFNIVKEELLYYVMLITSQET